MMLLIASGSKEDRLKVMVESSATSPHFYAAFEPSAFRPSSNFLNSVR